MNSVVANSVGALPRGAAPPRRSSAAAFRRPVHAARVVASSAHRNQPGMANQHQRAALTRRPVPAVPERRVAAGAAAVDVEAGGAEPAGSLLKTFFAVFIAAMGAIEFGYHIAILNGPLELIASQLGFAGQQVLLGGVSAASLPDVRGFSEQVVSHPPNGIESRSLRLCWWRGWSGRGGSCSWLGVFLVAFLPR